MNEYAWLIKREFWENRAIWFVPALIGMTLTLGALFGKVEVQGDFLGGMVLFGFGVTFFLVMNLYSTWYLLDCLYADRKDRSILFWKSLPISDTKTVLAKLFTGVLVIPLVYFIAADLSTLLIAFIVSVRTHSTLADGLWQIDLWLQLQALWIYVIVTTAIWYLPFVGYLLVISAWAKRAVVLWSIMPPLAAYLLERWFFGTHWVGILLSQRAFGYRSVAFHGSSEHDSWAGNFMGGGLLSFPGSVWRLLDPVEFVSRPATWIGVLVGIALIIGAIQLRLRITET
jgi:ABC-2 type transport system permease protein